MIKNTPESFSIFRRRALATAKTKPDAGEETSRLSFGGPVSSARPGQVSHEAFAHCASKKSEKLLMHSRFARRAGVSIGSS